MKEQIQIEIPFEFKTPEKELVVYRKDRIERLLMYATENLKKRIIQSEKKQI